MITVRTQRLKEIYFDAVSRHRNLVQHH